MAVFEFGPLVLDPAKRSLLRDGVPQSLTPKAFDVLMLLVQHRERVVSKEELLSSLWPGTFVEEANLSQQIFVLRRTLNGNSESVEYITTTPRRGYRFTADIPGAIRERWTTGHHCRNITGVESRAVITGPLTGGRTDSSWRPVGGDPHLVAQ